MSDNSDKSDTPAIVLDQVDIGYGGDPVVRGVCLEVRAHELHVLLGESGSGKTTILRAIAGFESVSRGRIELFGEVVDRGQTRGYRPPEKRGVGVVFQDYALFPHLDVAGNVGFGMRERNPRTIAELLERVGLSNMGPRHVSELSGGQQQRVALARALAQDPRIILLDEPFSNLNRQLRDELRQSTADILRAGGVTAIFVTHDRHEAFALADRISVIGVGRVLQTGTCREIYEQPASEEVARSVGDAVVLPARVLESRDVVTCALGEVRLGASAPEVGACRILLRPDQLTLERTTAPDHEPGTDAPRGSDSPPGADADAVPTATVERVVYYGQTDEVRVRLSDGAQLVTHTSPRRVRAGDCVRVRVHGVAALLIE